MNAFMLKWIYEGAISFAEDEVQKIFRSVKSSYIQINHKPTNMSPVERKFFEIIENVAKNDDDGKLRQKEIEKYMKNNSSEIKSFVEKFPENSLKTLVDNGYLANDKKKRKFAIGKNQYKNNVTVTDSGIDLYEKPNQV